MKNSSINPHHDQSASPPNNNGWRKRSIRGALITGLAQVVKTSISVGSQIVLARLLFPSDFGLVAMISPIIAFIQIFNDAGLGQIIIKRATLDQSHLSNFFWFNISISCILAFIAVLLAPITAWFYGDPRITGAIAALALIFPCAALNIHPVALLMRQMKFGAIAVSEIIAALIGVLVTIYFAAQDWSYWALIFGMMSSTFAGVVLNWFLCSWRPSRPDLSYSIKEDLEFSKDIIYSNLATFLISSGDNVIIGRVNGETSLGLYDRSYRLVVLPIGQMISPINRIALPLLCRLIETPTEYRACYMQMARLIMYMTVPIMLVCIVNSQIIITKVLGDRWIEAGPIFKWICVGGLTSAIFSSAPWLYISQGRTRELRNYLWGAAVLNIVSFLVGSVYGIVAVAAAAASVFVLVTTPLVLYGATRSGPVSVRDMNSIMITFVIEGFVVFLLLIIQADNFAFEGFAQVLASLSITYVALFLLTLVIPAERVAALNLFRRMLSMGKSGL